jgi:ribosomal protein S18 acetylase RimI-like enzyme
MGREDLDEVVTLLAPFLASDDIAQHAQAYGGAGDDAAIRRAIGALLDRPELGFVWLVTEDSLIAAAAVVCFAVSTNLGGIVAKIPDFVVREDRRSIGIGSYLLSSLTGELAGLGAGRIDLGVHSSNAGARRFYERHGFVTNHEIGMTLRIRPF